MTQDPKLIDKLSSPLPPEGGTLINAAISCARRSHTPTFLIGGSIRDLLLGLPSLDIDIAVEGDAVGLARAVAADTGADVAKSTPFGTAALRLGDFTMDLATARSESYARPGALPKVRPSTIDDDLLRRDFTINAIALGLTGTAKDRLLDPAAGEADLKARLVRVLHDRSFQDDATRIVRAIRYEARFGFRIEGRTIGLLRRDLAFLDTISGTRLRRELVRTFEEAEPERPLLRMTELGVLRAIHAALAFGGQEAEATRRLRTLAPGARTAVSYWPLLVWQAKESKIADVVRRLALTRAQALTVLAVPAARAVEGQIVGLRPSELVDALSALPLATALTLAATTSADGVRERVMEYATRLRYVRPALRGDDVISLGVSRGPEVGEVLERLRIAKLDGQVLSRGDEERLVRRHLESQKAASLA